MSDGASPLRQTTISGYNLRSHKHDTSVASLQSVIVINVKCFSSFFSITNWRCAVITATTSENFIAPLTVVEELIKSIY